MSCTHREVGRLTDRWLAINEVPVDGSKSSDLALCENEHHRNDMHGSDGELLHDSQNEATPRRQSFLEKILGRKVSKGK